MMEGEMRAKKVKTCKTCGSEKPIGDFYIVGIVGGKVYTYNQCKRCKIERAREYDKKNKDKKRERALRYYHRTKKLTNDKVVA